MMNLVFMNSLEKLVGERVLNAQISISEQHGKWQVFWSEEDPAGKVLQEDWYEGNGWEEMMQVFRNRISEKLGEGFLPVLDGVTEHFETPKGREERQQMIVCYSELHRNEQLYEELREWRRNLAFKDNKAAYIIATNRILGLISAYIPKTKEELRQIPGFGAHRMENYGEAILAITAKYERQTEFPLDWVKAALDRKKFTIWYYQQKHLKIRKETDEHVRRKSLLEQIAQGATLAEITERFELPLRDAVQWIEQLEEEGYSIEPLIDSELKQIPDTLREPALAAFAEHGDRYLKPIFTTVYGEEPPEGVEMNQIYAWLRILRIHYRRLQDSMVKV